MFDFVRGHAKQLSTAIPAPEPTINEGELLASLDLLLAGKYLSVPAGNSPLSHKIRQLADHLHDKTLSDAKRIVEVSIIGNEAVTASAEMMRDISKANSRAQAIAAAAEELVASVTEISRNADATNDEAYSAQQLADQGQQAADDAVKSMENGADGGYRITQLYTPAKNHPFDYESGSLLEQISPPISGPHLTAHAIDQYH